jgi:hypothetical protein
MAIKLSHSRAKVWQAQVAQNLCIEVNVDLLYYAQVAGQLSWLRAWESGERK